MRDDIQITTLRIPKKLKEKVRKLADANDRSMNWMYLELIRLGVIQENKGNS